MADNIDPSSVANKSVDKITPTDKRITHASFNFKGRDWHYLTASPPSPRATVLLIHGFPDISFAWRYQIPLLLSLNCRVLALDCVGYGSTGVSPDLNDYTCKHHADAIAALAAHISAPHIILGGHDWGGAVVYRAAQWYPELVTHVFSIATPYFPVMEQFVPMEVLAGGPLPQFGYQLQFGSKEKVVEQVVRGREMVGRFLRGMYGGQVASGRAVATPERGMDLEVLKEEEVGETPLLDSEEMDYYVSEFLKNDIEGPCNWYRTGRINFDDEKAMPAENREGVFQPTLFITALHDSVLTPEMSEGMEGQVPNLTRGEVKASHWALWHTPQETNDLIKNWFEGVVFGGKSKIGEVKASHWALWHTPQETNDLIKHWFEGVVFSSKSKI